GAYEGRPRGRPRRDTRDPARAGRQRGPGVRADRRRGARTRREGPRRSADLGDRDALRDAVSALRMRPRGGRGRRRRGGGRCWRDRTARVTFPGNAGRVPLLVMERSSSSERPAPGAMKPRPGAGERPTPENVRSGRMARRRAGQHSSMAIATENRDVLLALEPRPESARLPRRALARRGPHEAPRPPPPPPPPPHPPQPPPPP